MQIIYLFINCYIVCCLCYIYGLPLAKHSKFHNTLNKVAFTVLFGSVTISLIALIINFFFPLNKIIGNLFLVFALLISYKFIFKEKDFSKILKSIFLIALLSFIFISYETINRPDAGLYHLPFIQIIHENKILIGLTNLHFRFGHVSSVQYFSGIFKNSFMPIEVMNLPILILMCSFLIYLISFFDKKFEDNHQKILIFLITMYCMYSFNRYSNYGNDASVHVFTFLYLIYVMKKNFNNNDLVILILISVFLFTQKIFMSLLLLPTFFMFLFNKNIKKIKILLDYRVLISSLFILAWIIKNILISGCLVYPIEKTCIKNIHYSDISKTKQIRIESEAWAKDWINQDNIENPSIYIEKFRWISTWKKNHFKQIIKKIFPYLIFLIIFVFYSFTLIAKQPANKNQNILISNKKFILVFLFSLLMVFLWFVKFPLYRYGQSIILIPIIIFSYYIIIKYTDVQKIQKTTKSLVGVMLILILFKNFDRIVKNVEIRNIWPNIYTLSDKIDDNFKKELQMIMNKNKFLYYYNSNGECMYNKAPCSNYKITNLSTYKKFSYKIYFLEY